MKNYKDAMKKMEQDGELSVSDPENKKRRQGTLVERLQITFPG